MTLSELQLEAISYKSIEFLAKQVVEGFITGLHKSPFHGFSVEFTEHKQYNLGESTRHIDWKLFSKTDKLFNKKYEEETNLRCRIILDVSGSMFYPFPNYDKLKFSTIAAACIAMMLQKQRDAVGLTTFSDKIEFESQVKSTAMHVNDLFRELSSILNRTEKSSSTSIPEVLHVMADRIHKRSLVVLFTDMFDQNSDQNLLFEALKHLKYKQHEIIFFHVFDKTTEFDFEFEDRPTLFQDVENNISVKVSPKQLQEQYLKTISDWNHELKIKCGQYKIDYIEIDVKDDFHKVLLPFFAKRKKM